MRKSRKCIVGLTLSLLTVFLCAQEENSNRIVYVNLKLIDGQVSLQDYRLVEGKLKQDKTRTPQNGDVYFKVLDEKNFQLYEASIDDPAQLIYEYVTKDGTLGRKSVSRDSVQFTVRVPYKQSISEIHFFRTQSPGLKTSNSMRKVQSIGSVKLDLGSVNAQN